MCTPAFKRLHDDGSAFSAVLVFYVRPPEQAGKALKMRNPLSPVQRTAGQAATLDNTRRVARIADRLPYYETIVCSAAGRIPPSTMVRSHVPFLFPDAPKPAHLTLEFTNSSNLQDSQRTATLTDPLQPPVDRALRRHTAPPAGFRGADNQRTVTRGGETKRLRRAQPSEIGDEDLCNATVAAVDLPGQDEFSRIDCP